VPGIGYSPEDGPLDGRKTNKNNKDSQMRHVTPEK